MVDLDDHDRDKLKHGLMIGTDEHWMIETDADEVKDGQTL